MFGLPTTHSKKVALARNNHLCFWPRLLCQIKEVGELTEWMPPQNDFGNETHEAKQISFTACVSHPWKRLWGRLRVTHCCRQPEKRCSWWECRWIPTGLLQHLYSSAHLKAAQQIIPSDRIYLLQFFGHRLTKNNVHRWNTIKMRWFLNVY